jgi:hypothetical protein
MADEADRVHELVRQAPVHPGVEHLKRRLP